MEIKLFILICVICFTTTTAASTKKKSTEEAVASDETTPIPGPAILAIEIVDGSDNSTDVRNNTKRTIESALGYGYQGNYYPTSTGKKYMIYPYSQRDIPPAKSGADTYSTNLNIQKSVSYNLGTKTEIDQGSKELLTPAGTQAPVYSQAPQQQYYPSTLFSTIGQSGNIGGLSSNFPSQHQAPTATIPVIILRVYTNQLESPAIYPNLPQSHPYANNLNSINIQHILSNYIQKYMQQAIQSINPTSYPQQSSYPTSNLVYQGYQGNQDNQGHQGGHQLYQDKNNYAYYQQPQVVYQPQSSAEYKDEPTLPTSENYPSDSHTRVIYHGPKGHIQNLPNYGYSTASSVSQEYGVPKNSYSTNQNSQISQIKTEYGPPKSTYSTNQISQINQISQEYLPRAKPSSPSYETKFSQQQQVSYETPKQTYSSPDPYQNNKQTYNSNEVFTDSNGQSYIYVYPNQMQQQYYQPEYQADYSQQSYAQSYTSAQPTYSSQEYSSQSQEYQPQEDRKYLPTPTPELPTKLYNYHADSIKDRSKKSSGSPVTFETKKEKTSNKN